MSGCFSLLWGYEHVLALVMPNSAAGEKITRLRFAPFDRTERFPGWSTIGRPKKPACKTHAIPAFAYQHVRQRDEVKS